MTNLLPETAQLSAFLFASFVLAVTPGPGVAYILARSLLQGRAAGLASVFGVAVGNFGNALAAAFGLAALFAISSLAFTVVKWVGAAYLIGLGVHMLWTARAAHTPSPGALVPVAPAKLVRDGFVVSLLNPKTTIFFAAFLPQFMRPDVSPVAQSILLGAIFVGIAAVTDCVYALAAGWFAPKLRARNSQRSAALGKRVLGSTFIGMGLLTALTGQKAK